MCCWKKHIDDYWNVDGERELSDAWTGFTRYLLLTERPLDGYTWSGEVKLTRKQNNLPSRQCMARYVEKMSAKKKAKQRGAIEKPKLFFIEPNDEEFKLTMKAARRKVGSSDASCNALQKTEKVVEKTHRSIGKRKTKYACVVDADESTRPRLEGAVHKYHQDHITEKRMNF